MTKKESQNKSIANYLMAGNAITSKEALELFGCRNLFSIISELRKEGYIISLRRKLTSLGIKISEYYMFENE